MLHISKRKGKLVGKFFRFIDKAIDLYKKGGNLKKAMEMARKHNLNDELNKIASMVDN